MLDQEQLKQYVHYDSATGVFTRAVSRGGNQFGAQFSRWKVGDVMGFVNSRGYRRISISGKIYQAHRLAWLYHYGAWPKDQIDHINGNRCDNRIDNLREVTNAENGKNTSRHRGNKTGVSGVHIHSQNGNYVAQIRVSNRLIHLGCFDNIFDAACARKSAEYRFGFHANHGRAPF